MEAPTFTNLPDPVSWGRRSAMVRCACHAFWAEGSGEARDSGQRPVGSCLSSLFSRSLSHTHPIAPHRAPVRSLVYQGALRVMEEPMVLGPPVDAPLYMEPPVDGVPANATFDLYCYYFAVGGPNGLLTIPIPNTKITISDTIVFLMSCICLVFLLVMLPATVRRFRATKVRALYVGYYTICWIAVITRIIRTILWWTVYHNENDLNLAGSITWIALRTLLWTVEISVLVCIRYDFFVPRCVPVSGQQFRLCT
jgi:hypothetical protein